MGLLMDTPTSAVLTDTTHPCTPKDMVIRMTDSANNQNSELRRTAKLRTDHRNTRAEFKRLKTILPSIKRKENVSKLDIILEAIKYIDDLQDQLFDRLSGTHSQREATLLALTEEDMERSRARLNALRDENNEEMTNDMSTDEETESKANEVSSDE